MKQHDGHDRDLYWPLLLGDGHSYVCCWRMKMLFYGFPREQLGIESIKLATGEFLVSFVIAKRAVY